MEKFEKVERLSKAAKVSFEEARKALEENNWDLLEAMSALEKEGRTVIYDVECTATKSKKQSFKEGCRRVFDFIKYSTFHISRNDQQYSIPLWICVIILAVAWHISIIALIAGLILGYRYSLSGQEDMTRVNKFMDGVSDFTEQAKNEFNM